MNPTQMIPPELHWLWSATWQAAVLVALVLLIQGLGRNLLSPSSRFVLWWLVLIRLCLPVTPESAWSVFNLAPQRATPIAPAHIVSDRAIPEPLPAAVVPTEFVPAASSQAWTASIDPVTAVSSESMAMAGAAGDWRVHEPRDSVASVGAWLFWIWLIGAMVYGAWLLTASLLLGRHLRRQRPLREPVIERLLNECRQQMGIRRQIDVIETARVRSPALFGLVRPRLLIPPGFLRAFTETELRHVLLHELAHLRRGDLMLNWVMVWIQAMHWFNPLVWVLFTRIRSDRELACDALAMARTAQPDRATYGQTVLKLLERLSAPSPVPGSVGVLEDRRAIERRVQSIIRFRPHQRFPWAVVALWIALAGLTLTDGRSVAAEAEVTPAERRTSIAAVAGEDRASMLARYKEIDRENLRQIFAAIQAYRERHGELPDWLSDLYPEFLTDPEILISPEERLTGRTRLEGNPDPRMRTSYIYEFNANPAPADHVGDARISYKEWKTRQMDRFGAAVPLVRCLLYDPTLNLAYSGDVYESELFWERDPNTLALMRRLGVGTTLAPSDVTEALELQVVGRDSDTPIEGVRVMAWLQSEEGLLPTQVWVTDGDGVCPIPLAGARPRYGILRLSHPAHVSRELKWHDGDIALLPSQIRIQMNPAVPIQGTVRNDLSQPVEGARLRFRLHEQETAFPGWTESNLILDEEAEVTTDGEGRWAFTRLPMEFARLTIELDHPDYLVGRYEVPTTSLSRQFSTESPTLQSHIDRWAALVLSPYVNLSGRVVDENGTPLQGALVEAWLGPGRQLRAVSDAQGRYRAQGLPPGGAVLVIRREGYRPESVEVKPDDVQGAIVTVLERGEPLRVRVLDIEGNPLGGVAVRLQGWQGQGHLSWHAETQAAGTLEWHGAPEDALYGFAKAGYRDVNRRQVPATGTIFEVTLEPAFRVRGTVTDATTRSPIDRFAIVRGTSRGTTSVRWDLHRVPLGTGGRFETEFNDIDIAQTHGYVEIEANGFFPRLVGPMPMVDVEFVEVAVEMKPIPPVDLAREQDAPPLFQMRLVAATAGANAVPMTITHRTGNRGETVEDVMHVRRDALLDHTAIASAVARRDALGNPVIEVQMTQAGTLRFAEVTRANIGRQLAVVVDGRLLIAPRINAEITAGLAQIAGDFSEQEAAVLAARINAAVRPLIDG
jgi:beta-lactamase regulating signal transducer with metallopeptidase domain